MKSGIAILPVLLGMTAAQAAHAEDWTVVKLVGTAKVRTTSAPSTAVTLGMQVAPNASVGTGDGSWVRLQRGPSTITVSPGTTIQVSDQGPSTTLVEHKGSVELDLETRGKPYFNVRTPTMAAVVKGTHFSVTTGRAGSSVQVQRGLVEVRDVRSGQTADLGPGQGASTATARPSLSVSGSTSVPSVREGSVSSSKGAASTRASGGSASQGSSGTSSSAQGQAQGSSGQQSGSRQSGSGGNGANRDSDSGGSNRGSGGGGSNGNSGNGGSNGNSGNGGSNGNSGNGGSNGGGRN